jgi:hypothetical protein
MEKTTRDAGQNLEPTPERMAALSPEECPTCLSGLDPTLRDSGGLFQEALLESL